MHNNFIWESCPNSPLLFQKQFTVYPNCVIYVTFNIMLNTTLPPPFFSFVVIGRGVLKKGQLYTNTVGFLYIKGPQIPSALAIDLGETASVTVICLGTSGSCLGLSLEVIFADIPSLLEVPHVPCDCK